MNIVVCPGHYDAYPGVKKNGFSEHVLCVEIASEIRALSKGRLDARLDAGVTVVMGTLKNKVTKINEINPDIAIEIHLGNSNNVKMSGTRAFFTINDAASKRLADSLSEACSSELGTENNGSWVGWYKKIGPRFVQSGRAPQNWKPKIDMFLSSTRCVSALIEPFFLSSPSDCEKFTSPEAIDSIALSILDGINKYCQS